MRPGSDTVLWDREDAVTTITLNRPRARNALTAEMKDALLEAVGRTAAEPAIRAVVLTGDGEAFCAGQDLREHVGVLASGGEPTGTVRRHYNPRHGCRPNSAAPPITGRPPSPLSTGSGRCSREASRLHAAVHLGAGADDPLGGLHQVGGDLLGLAAVRGPPPDSVLAAPNRQAIPDG